MQCITNYSQLCSVWGKNISHSRIIVAMTFEIKTQGKVIALMFAY